MIQPPSGGRPRRIGETWASAGVLVYRNTADGPRWLLIDSKLSRRRPAWQFPKGRIEPGETPRQAAMRECEEETGVPLIPEQLDPNFHERIEWTFRHRGMWIQRSVDFFLAETDQIKTIPDWEVCEIRWCLFADSHRMLQHDDLRTVLEKAHELLGGNVQSDLAAAPVWYDDDQY